jgi:hypothetical protein
VVKKELAEVTPVTMKQRSIDNLKYVIGKLYQMKIVLISRENLTRVSCKILRVCLTSKKVFVEKVALLHDPKTNKRKCKIKKEAIHAFSHHLNFDLTFLRTFGKFIFW